MNKTYYTLATKTSSCYGHGDYRDDFNIKQMRSYGTEGYPPLFETKELAEEYKSGIKWNSDLFVVPMNVFQG